MDKKICDILNRESLSNILTDGTLEQIEQAKAEKKKAEMKLNATRQKKESFEKSYNIKQISEQINKLNQEITANWDIRYEMNLNKKEVQDAIEQYVNTTEAITRKQQNKAQLIENIPKIESDITNLEIELSKPINPKLPTKLQKEIEFVKEQQKREKTQLLAKLDQMKEALPKTDESIQWYQTQLKEMTPLPKLQEKISTINDIYDELSKKNDELNAEIDEVKKPLVELRDINIEENFAFNECKEAAELLQFTELSLAEIDKRTIDLFLEKIRDKEEVKTLDTELQKLETRMQILKKQPQTNEIKAQLKDLKVKMKIGKQMKQGLLFDEALINEKAEKLDKWKRMKQEAEQKSLKEEEQEIKRFKQEQEEKKIWKKIISKIS